MSSSRSLGNLLNILLEGFVEWGDQQGELSHPVMIAHIAQQVGERLLFPRGDSLLKLSYLPFLSIKGLIFPYWELEEGPSCCSS